MPTGSTTATTFYILKANGIDIEYIIFGEKYGEVAHTETISKRIYV